MNLGLIRGKSKKSKKMTEEIKKITHIVGSVSRSLSGVYLIARAYLIARVSRERARERMRASCDCERDRERERNFHLRFSPEVKTETKTKLLFG